MTWNSLCIPNLKTIQALVVIWMWAEDTSHWWKQVERISFQIHGSKHKSMLLFCAWLFPHFRWKSYSGSQNGEPYQHFHNVFYEWTYFTFLWLFFWPGFGLAIALLHGSRLVQCPSRRWWRLVTDCSCAGLQRHCVGWLYKGASATVRRTRQGRSLLCGQFGRRGGKTTVVAGKITASWAVLR